MSNRTKKWIIIATSLIVLGLILFIAVMMVNQWDFAKLNTVKYESNTYQINEDFNNISLKTDTANILFVPSDDGICKVACYEQEKSKHSVSVNDGTLTINLVDVRKWYEHIINISIDEPKITVYLPKDEYAALLVKESTGSIEIPENFKFESIDISASTGGVKCYSSVAEFIKITTTTGDICVENVSTGSLDLSVTTGNVIANSITCEGDITVGVSTGKTDLTNVKCKNINSIGSTGGISLKNVIATEQFSIERSTGSVKFDGSDAAGIFVETSTGNVKGSLLSEKVFITETSTGDVSIPRSVTGGKCEITTSTGDIKIEIE